MTASCGTCAHWLTQEYSPLHDEMVESAPLLVGEGDGMVVSYVSDDHGYVRAPGRWGYCTKVAEFGPRANSKFYVIDGSEYLAKLGTREDFGCVEYEPADPA